MIEWVVLDVGETLIDETRVWATWAQNLGVSPLTFGAALGVVIARGLEHRAAFELLRVPDWESRRGDVERAYGGFRADDLYPDALRTVDALRAQGRRVAVLANQPAKRHAELEAIGVHPDVMAMSEELGVSKPDRAFFDRSLDLMGRPRPEVVAYVGDRIDNDVSASRRCGFRSVWLRRGPWGRLQEDISGEADLTVWTLDELVERLPELEAGGKPGPGT
jgi:FMN hydrolase / 5-amino-6-(5-phospho-D-ribitylamino)uracil phosphatase